MKRSLLAFALTLAACAPGAKAPLDDDFSGLDGKSDAFSAKLGEEVAALGVRIAVVEPSGADVIVAAAAPGP